MGNCCRSSEGLKYNHHRSNSLAEFGFKPINSSSEFPQNINDPVAILNNVLLNPLGLALYYGQLHTFKLLIEAKGADPSVMESLFEKQNLTSIEIAIQRQSTSVIEHYFPLFFITSTMSLKNDESYKKPLIHLVIETGNFQLLNYFYLFFSDVTPPSTFDFHYIDPNTEENSAFIAAKSRNLEIIRFLNETVKADFTVINSKGQSALHAVFSETKNKSQLVDCTLIKYLIEKCKVDLVYEFEVLLLTIGQVEIAKYVEEELKKFGIWTSRNEVMAKASHEKKLQAMKGLIWEEDSDVIITTISDLSSVQNENQIDTASGYFTHDEISDHIL